MNKWDQFPQTEPSGTAIDTQDEFSQPEIKQEDKQQWWDSFPTSTDAPTGPDMTPEAAEDRAFKVWNLGEKEQIPVPVMERHYDEISDLDRPADPSDITAGPPIEIGESPIFNRVVDNFDRLAGMPEFQDFIDRRKEVEDSNVKAVRTLFDPAPQERVSTEPDEFEWPYDDPKAQAFSDAVLSAHVQQFKRSPGEFDQLEHFDPDVFEPTSRQKLAMLTDMDFEFVYDTLTHNPIRFTPEEGQMIRRESLVRSFTEALREAEPGEAITAMAALRYGNIFNFNEWASRMGVNVPEKVMSKVLGVGTDGWYTAALEAGQRYLWEVQQEKPYGAEWLAMLGADIATAVTEFGMTSPFLGPAAVGKKLTTVQRMGRSASTLALREGMQAPREGEEILDRIGSVAMSGAYGAVLGGTKEFLPSILEIPLVTAGLSGMTYMQTGDADAALETAATVLGFRAVGLMQKAARASSRGVRNLYADKAVREARRHNPDLYYYSNKELARELDRFARAGINFQNVPPEAMTQATKGFLDIQRWRQDAERGKVSPDVAGQRIADIQNSIRPVVEAMLRQTRPDPKARPDERPRQETPRQITDMRPDDTAPPPPVSPRQPVLKPEMYPTEEVPVGRLALSEDVPQFKEAADPETGVVAGQELQGVYNRLGTAPIVVWERTDGNLEVITGRHRLELARRTGEETIPAQIVRESDGFDQDMALTFDAESNIRDGQGSVKDYAHYFRNSRTTEEEARQRGLLSRFKGHVGFTIGKSASDDLYSAFTGGKISERKAYAIASGAPDDEAAQHAAMARAKTMSAEELEQFARILARTTEEDRRPTTQGDLFGFDDSAIQEADAVAKEVAKEQKQLKDRILAVQGALRRPGAARRMGLEFFSDEESIRGEVQRLTDRIDELSRTASNPELYQEMLERAGLRDSAEPPTNEERGDIQSVERGEIPEGVTDTPTPEGLDVPAPPAPQAATSPQKQPWEMTATNGKRMLYHGTTGTFDKFDKEKTGRRDSGNLGTGVYLSDDAHFSYLYAEGNVEKFGGQPTVMGVEIPDSLNIVKITDSLRNELKKKLGYAFPAKNKQQSDEIAQYLQEKGIDGLQSGTEIVIFDIDKADIVGVSADRPPNPVVLAHRDEIKKLTEEGRDVGRATLEEFKGEAWADEAIKRLDTPAPQAAEAPQKSKGHVAFIEGNEYYKVESGDLYRAPVSNVVMPDGRRSGRFEATAQGGEKPPAEAPAGPTVETPSEKTYGKKNRFVSKDEYEEILRRQKAAERKRTKDKRRGAAYTPGSQDFKDAVKLGMYHLEAGTRSFAEWSKKMLKDLGGRAKPHLEAIWVQSADQFAAVSKERGFITSVRNANPELKVQGQYIPRSTDILAMKARNLIKDDPVLAEKMALDAKDDQSVAVLAELLKHYGKEASQATNPQIKQAMEEKAAQLANESARNLTELGRAVQAASILSRLTPEGQIRFAAREIQRYNEKVEKGKGGLLGLQKKIPELTPDQMGYIRSEMEAIQGMPEGEERALRMFKLNNYISDLVPTPLYKKLVTIWRAGLLTGMRTTGLNLWSNKAHFVTETAKDLPASLVDQIVSMMTKERAVTFNLEGIPSGSLEGVKRGIRYMWSGYDQRDVGTKLDYRRINWGKHPAWKAVGVYTDTVFRWMGTQDQPFYYAAFFRSMYEQAKVQAINEGLKGEEAQALVDNLVNNPTERMLENAEKDARGVVFQNKTLLGQVGKKVQQLPGGEFAVPFTRSPSAVIMQAINYSPVGAVSTVLENIGNDRFDQRDFSKGIGRSILGIPAIVIGAALYRTGRVSLDYPDSEAEREQWRLEGRRPNAVRVDLEDGGSEWQTPIVWGPMGNLLLVGAHFQRAFDDSGSPTEAFEKAIIGTAKSFTEQTFLTGVNRILEALTDPEARAGQVATQTLASFIPTIVADVARATDDLQRRTETLQERMMARVPVLRERLEPQIDALGRERTRPTTIHKTMLDPRRPTTEIDDPVVNELRRLWDAGHPATPTRLGGRDGFETLTPEENTTIQRLAGQMAYDGLKQFMASPAYNPDHIRELAIQDLEGDEAAKVARDFVIGEHDRLVASGIRNIIHAARDAAITAFMIPRLEETNSLPQNKQIKKLLDYRDDGLLPEAVSRALSGHSDVLRSLLEKELIGQ